MKIPKKNKLREKVTNLDELDRFVGGAKTASLEAQGEAARSPVADTISLRTIWTVCLARWKRMAIAFAATLALAAVVTMSVTPIYESTSVLLVLLGQRSIRPGETVSSRDREALVNDQVEILLSRDLHESVVRKMGIDALYPDLVAASESPELVLAAAIRRFRGNLFLQTAKSAGSTIHVTFRHKNPVTAAEVVNLLVDLFKEKHLETFSDPRSREFLEDKFAEYRVEMEQAEERLKTYQTDNVLVSDRGQRDQLLAERTRVVALLRQAESERNGVREKVRYLGDLSTKEIAAAIAHPQHAEAVARARTRLLELRLNEKNLRGRYSATSRQVVNVREQIQLVEEFLEQQEAQMVAALPKELVDARSELLLQEARIRSFSGQVARLDRQIAGAPIKEKRLRELLRERDTAEENYQVYAKKLEETRIADEMDRKKIANISVIQEATVPTVPVRPRPRLNLALGALLGIGIAVGLALFAGPRRETKPAKGSAADRRNAALFVCVGLLAVPLAAFFLSRGPAGSSAPLASPPTDKPSLTTNQSTVQPQAPTENESDSFNDQLTKTLEPGLEGGEWKILREKETTQASGEQEFELLDFDATGLPPEIQYKGRIVDGMKWRDKNNINYLIISEYTEGEFASRGYKSELYASCYNNGSGRLRQSWEIRDFSRSNSEEVAYWEGTLRLDDVDGDGFGESSFFYLIESGGHNPARIKYMLHSKGEKLPIRGVLPKRADVWSQQYEKSVDPAFQAASTEIKDYASRAWDELVGDFREGLLGTGEQS